MRLVLSMLSIAAPAGSLVALLPAIAQETAPAKTVAPAETAIPVPDAAPEPPAAFGKCSGCHATVADRASPGGPNLFGIGGRVSGTLPRAIYSAAMKKAAIVWDEQSLDAFIANPGAAVPGNTMFSVPEKDEAARKEIVAYLLSLK